MNFLAKAFVTTLAAQSTQVFARQWPGFGENTISLTSTKLYPTSERQIEVDIRIPEVPGKAEAELPMIIYSHGVWSNNRENIQLLDYLASKGFRVVAATSPHPTDTGDLVNKAEDMAFLQKHFGVDSSNTVMMGYSLGSLAALVAGNQQNAAQIIAIAPPAHELFETRENITLPANSTVPTDVIVGTADSVSPIKYSIPLAENIGAKVHKVEKGTHLGFITAGSMTPALTDNLLCRYFESHYPAEYHCPPIALDRLSVADQQKATKEIIDEVLRKISP